MIKLNDEDSGTNDKDEWRIYEIDGLHHLFAPIGVCVYSDELYENCLYMFAELVTNKGQTDDSITEKSRDT
jgi:hypothetical protein